MQFRLKKYLPIVTATFALAAASASANAVPFAPVKQIAPSSDAMLIQYRYDHRPPMMKKGPPPRPHYVPGRRYDRAPPNWHRYNSRPRDWSRRGCVAVGPLWFCP